MAAPAVDFTPKLRTLMTQVEISSFNQLSQRSGVPRSQLVKLRRGDVARIPLGSLIALAQVLQVSREEILDTFEVMMLEEHFGGGLLPEETSQTGSSSVSIEEDRRQWQKDGLNILESLILQLPTAAVAAQNNPTAPAIRLLPLLKPLDALLESWDVETIGAVGDTLAFNPQYHQWMGGADFPEKESPVKVRYVGYRHGDRLLHRAKVGPL